MIHHLETTECYDDALLSGIEPLHLSQPTIQIYLSDVPAYNLST